MKIILVDDEGNVHTLVEHLTGVRDDAYLEVLPPGAAQPDWFDPADIARDVDVLATQIALAKRVAKKKKS